ncbi:hypothetical protein Tco_0770366 [Tanacetum coccineum]|uniref:Uncharacterized protein n=1 Tax=Tanacetum coccineum TaxID=301880 RepID=A0ABQ4ZFB3_9ASTR
MKRLRCTHSVFAYRQEQGVQAAVGVPTLLSSSHMQGKTQTIRLKMHGLKSLLCDWTQDANEAENARSGRTKAKKLVLEAKRKQQKQLGIVLYRITSALFQRKRWRIRDEVDLRVLDNSGH